MQIVADAHTVDERVAAALADDSVTRAADVPGLQTAQHLAREIRQDREAAHRFGRESGDVRARERHRALAQALPSLATRGWAAVVVVPHLDGEVGIDGGTADQR